MDLREIDADAVLEIIDKGDVDYHNCWLGRAYATFGSGPVPRAFHGVLSAEVAKVIAALGEIELAGRIALYRGLSCEPDLSSIGRHWSDSRAVALEHGPYILKANVCADDVDWCGTVLRRIGWPREREFTLKPEALILVETIACRGHIISADVEVSVSKSCPTPSLR
ncbi:hypothetical protein ACFOY8_11965 [Thalassospira xianhensis]|uniref:Uncharacterized protein n=2 Tax=Thalassospira TaxID=168934 RepID=A0A285TY78_9PROT|nr:MULTISPECIES: hypothetical protein [Thalassospira]RCK04146.1 hypothetical protein TH5_21450 [Thalassospira xianhensis MCCC 1A02616]SOC30539.1 hypothetical protein SAMN05428964_10990 [Thalassospira xiamenensis]